jgi:hypothetical protein
MKTWRARHDRFIAAIAARNAAHTGPAPAYAIAIRPAFKPVAASALTAIANAVGAPVAAPLVALWSAPLDFVAEYDAARGAHAFGRTLALLTPSDAKHETLALRALADELDFALGRNAIAFGWIHSDAVDPPSKSWLVLEPDSGAISLIRAPVGDATMIATPVASALDAALSSALSVGYWAGERAGIGRYLDAIGEAIQSEDRAALEDNAWLRALDAHAR